MTRVTVWRNVALVLSAVLAVVAGLRDVGGVGAAGPALDADGSHEREKTPAPRCSQRVRPHLAERDEQLGPVRVRAVVSSRPDIVSSPPYLAGRAYFDPYGTARVAFGVGSPAAVLLGTDGMLAGRLHPGAGWRHRRPVSSQASSPPSSSP